MEAVPHEARQTLPGRGRRRTNGLKEIGYFEHNINKMRYAEPQARGLFVGSGVIAAGCKTFNSLCEDLMQTGGRLCKWLVEEMERAKGFEPSTFTLAR